MKVICKIHHKSFLESLVPWWIMRIKLDLCLQGVKAHVGTIENDRSGKAVKTAAELNEVKDIGLPKNHIKYLLKHKLLSR